MNKEPKPWPEMFYLDPVTGEVPKNYKTLLKEDRAQRQSITEEEQLSIRADLEIFRQMKDMQKLFNSEYKKNDDGRKLSDKTRERKRLSRNLEFKVSTVRKNEKVIPKKMTNLVSKPSIASNNTKVIRKALFSDKAQNKSQKYASAPSGTGRPIKTKISDKSDETLPLLDISEAEKQLLNPKKKSQPSRYIFRKPNNIPPKKNLSHDTSPTVSSLEEYEKLEQQLKTPKSARKTQNAISDVSSVEIITEMNKLNKAVAEIRHDLNLILNHLNIKGGFNATANDNSNEDIENVPPMKRSKQAPNEGTMQGSLRIMTLEKNLKKKVLFNLEGSPEPNVKSKQSALKIESLQTPNTMSRCVKKRAEEQYLQLQDTPKL